ncbi:MAG: cyclic nucleotide-binding/CBS domain-containing protein [Thermoplasmata archaeon]
MVKIEVSDLMGKITVGEVMSINPLMMEKDVNLFDAVKISVQKGVSAIIVTDNGVPAGIVTDRDIVTKVVYRGLNPFDIKLGDIMTKPIITVKKDDPLEKAALLINKKKVRKLPVIDDGMIVGLLSENNIVKISPDLLLIAEKEEKNEGKEFQDEDIYYTGICEGCGKFSHELKYKNGMFLCPNCINDY